MFDDVRDNLALRREVTAIPDDDAPREAYAAWMAGQDSHAARLIGAFIAAQLRAEQAYRSDRRANIIAIRSWTGDGRSIRPEAYVAPGEFRAGDTLRAWFANSVRGLGGIGWPQVYRGFVERVWIRARRFLQIASQLCAVAPIRYLVLVGVAEVVDELAACVHLRRIRSLSLPRYLERDELTDRVLSRLLASPHLGNLVHLRLVDQRQLTSRAYASVVTAPTIPKLSSFEVYAPRVDDPWSNFYISTRCERMMMHDSPISSARSQDWIESLEREFGPLPHLHPERYYGPDPIDIEAVVTSPIAIDARLVSRREGGMFRSPWERVAQR